MISRGQLLNLYWSARAQIAPTLRHAQDFYEDVLKDSVHSDSVWLDLGCGHQVFPEWRFSEEKQLTQICKTVVGVDYDFGSLLHHRSIRMKVQSDIGTLPFADSSFNLVTANMVVEHLDNPEKQFNEVARVLKRGGIFIFLTPNASGYFAVLRRLVPKALNNTLVSLLDGRRSFDVFPVHYKANTAGRIKQLAESSQLEVLKQRLLVTDAVFSVVPPLMLIELLWLRALMTNKLRPWRTNILAILRKQ
jgi:ubiquinone/menaquinone biosynthesis C-methylase UbiE